MRRLMTLALIALVAPVPSAAVAQSLKSIAVIKMGERGDLNTTYLALSPDGRYLAFEQLADEAVVSVWDLVDRKKIGQLPLGKDAPGFGFPLVSAAPLRIARTSRDGTLAIWRYNKTAGRFLGKKSTQVSVDLSARFNADGKLVSVGQERVTVVDIENVDKSHTMVPRIHREGGAVSPDSRLFAASNFQDVDLYDIESGKERGSLLDHSGEVDQMAFRPDGKVLAVGSTRYGRLRKATSEIKLWDMATLKQTATTKEFPGVIRSLLHPLDGVVFVIWTETLDSSAVFKLYNTRTGEWKAGRTFTVRPPGMVLATSPAGVIAVADEGIVEAWRILPE